MNNSSKGMGCGTVLSIMLTVAFVVLKLCNVIDWSWWWVVSPILIYIGIVIIAYVIIIFFTGK
jgi:hypothetical protein